MSRMTRRLALALTLAATTVLGACGDDDDDDGGAGDSEVISRVIVTLTPAGGGGSQSARYECSTPTTCASDGTLSVAPGTTYRGTIEFLNAFETPPVDITAEVQLEADEHRVFYATSGVNGVSVAVTDSDDNGAPLGLEFDLVVSGTASGAGVLNAILSHYDDSPKGDGSIPSTETDVDADISLVVGT
ncbi:MAG: hypothetical protein MUC69_03465 [Gemmatimonadales bacterium]|jgi:hypothetical protein|nr:hypothetical protein [Gemmatimonadales bacterium]